MRKEFSAGAVVYHLDGAGLQYLVLHYGANHWDFSKGKLEAGENSERAAIREAKEETGLDVILDKEFEHKLFYKFKSRDGELVSKQVTFFTSLSPTKDVILSDEHSEFRWLPYEEARQILTYENAVNLLDRAHASITQLHNL